MNTLKPCPFCGKEPQEITLNGEPKVVCRCLVREPNIWNPRPIEDALNKRIAELEGFKMIVEGCGFEVITEPPVLNHPERKILKGHGTIYVPPEVQE